MAISNAAREADRTTLTERRLSERVLTLQQVLPFALLAVVMFYQVTRHLIFPASDHPALFAIEFLVFGLGAPALLWVTLNWIGQEIRARENAEDQADTRTRMLLEMQHRIKNNLQTVADLLSLELARPTTHPDAAQSLRDSMTRIKTIAAAHELLTADQVGTTDILDLAQRVAENARLAQIHPGQEIQIRVTGESVRLDSKAATAFALVVNELVSNTLEHGFANCVRGEIEIGIATDEPSAPLRRAYIVIQDSGAGLREGFEPKRDAGLGLRIVRTLIEKDLRGTFTLDNVSLPEMPVNGARAEFSFPI